MLFATSMLTMDVRRTRMGCSSGRSSHSSRLRSLGKPRVRAQMSRALSCQWRSAKQWQLAHAPVFSPTCCLRSPCWELQWASPDWDAALVAHPVVPTYALCASPRARALFHTQHLQLRRWEMSGKNEALDARAGKLKRSRSGGSSLDGLAGCQAWDARGGSAKH